MVTHGDPFTFRPLHVAIADDCPAMREGLARLVADECDLKVAGTAANTAELRLLVTRHPPRVLIMELQLDGGDGLALVGDLVAAAPEMRIVVFTRQPVEVYAARCLQAGASAFVAKNDAVTTLFRAVRQAADGATVLPQGVARNFFSAMPGAVPSAAGLASRLTNRELQVFRLAGLAMPTRDIARELGVSIKTVESHRENIKNKLALDSHAELVARAAQWLRESGTS